MAFILWISSLILFLHLLTQSILVLKNKKKLPPGPIGLPIIGHFHLVGKNPHQDLHHLAKKHGPIMYLRYGSIGTVVVSSPAAAELFLKTHDLVFADKPYNEAASYLAYEQRDIVLGKYGPYWRNMRKLVTLELLSAHKVSQFQPTRNAELGLFVSSLKRAAKAREAVNLSVKIMSLSSDITCLTLFSTKFSDSDSDFNEKGFKEAMKGVMEEVAAFNIDDYFPYLRRFNLKGALRLKLRNIFDGFLERIIDSHMKNKEEKNEKKQVPDFVDTMMDILESGEAEFEFDRSHVKAVLLDMLLAGIDTSAAAIEWTLSEIIKHPEIMKKLQKELEQVVGINQMVQESHLSSLKYLDCIIKESMRIHPPGPLIIHESMGDSEVNGFHIPDKTRILVNVWAIGRDPDAWSDPDKFDPERFLESNVDLRGQDFQLIPFGSGRRGCPGLRLGLTTVQFVVAQLVHCFDWELPNGMLHSDLDMFENFGLITARANHLMAIPNYRLKI